MGLPAYSESVRLMLDRLGPLALARLERMITDPKSKDRDVLDAAKMILARVAASSAGRTTVNLIGTSQTVAAIMEKGKALLAQPTPAMEPEDVQAEGTEFEPRG
jgi:hypothetical protein